MAQVNHEKFMRRAIELARKTAVEDNAGGPFAAVVVRDGEIIGEGWNRVVAEHDPTWHGEVAAIRDACRRLGTHDLSGCDLYTSCEPCPMCYAAPWWARIRKIYYGATIEDARLYGDFDDSLIYDHLKLPYAERKLPGEEILRDEMVAVWKEFQAKPDRVHY